MGRKPAVSPSARRSRPPRWGRWSKHLIGATGLACAISLLVMVPVAQAASATITSAGPLTNITISGELNCSVNHTGDAAGEFYDDTACATEITVGGALYGPASVPAGNSPGGYVSISQSAVTGSGTSGDPYKIVTVVDAGTSGLRLTQTDSYVVGQEAYRTDVQVTNSGTNAQSAILYRGGDCYLQSSDSGFGSSGSPAGSVACVAPAATADNPSAVPGTRIEQWVPLTAGSHYIEATFDTVWDAMSSMTNFPDTCDCATNEDNGAGLSWALSIPAGGSLTISNLTNFSPLGVLALSTTKTADQATVAAGAQDGYTITLSNPNIADVPVASISDTLAAGFSYVPGSTTGATTSDPTVSGQTLTWTGPFTVPAAGAAPGTTTLHFNVTVSSTPGTYYDNATADGGSYVVVATGDTAPVTVTAPAPTPTATATATSAATATATATATASPSPSQSPTPAATSTARDSSSGGATPLLALFICLALGCLGLVAVQAQRRVARR